MLRGHNQEADYIFCCWLLSYRRCNQQGREMCLLFTKSSWAMPFLIITTSAAVLISFPSSCFDITLYIDRMDVISSIFRKRETLNQILTQYQSTCSKSTFAKARYADKAQLGSKRRSMCHSFQKRSSWVSEYVHPGRHVPKVQLSVTRKCCLCLYKRPKCVGKASGKTPGPEQQQCDKSTAGCGCQLSVKWD